MRARAAVMSFFAVGSGLAAPSRVATPLAVVVGAAAADAVALLGGP
jgi:hypothetical protein